MIVANNVQQKLRWPAKSLKSKSYRPLVGSTEMQGSCTAATTKSLRELTCVIHQKCAAIPQEYIYRHSLSLSIWYLAVDATQVDVQSIEAELNTT